MNQIVSQEVEKVETAEKSVIVRAYPTLVKMEKLLQDTLPPEMCAKRLVRMFYIELSKSHTLNNCTIQSVVGAIMSCAQLGLEPGVAGMLFLVPRAGEVKIQLGYKGMIELSHRSGQVSAIKSYSVYKNDQFSIDFGTDDRIVHKRAIGIDRGEIIGVYAIIVMKDGTKHFDFMDIPEVEKIRERSSSPNSSAWIKDYAQMAQKTVIRRILKYAPTSSMVASAIALDEAHDYDGQDLSLVGRAALFEAGIVDPETGEIKQSSKLNKVMTS